MMGSAHCLHCGKLDELDEVEDKGPRLNTGDLDTFGPEVQSVKERQKKRRKNEDEMFPLAL